MKIELCDNAQMAVFFGAIFLALAAVGVAASWPRDVTINQVADCPAPCCVKGVE